MILLQLLQLVIECIFFGFLGALTGGILGVVSTWEYWWRDRHKN